MKDQARKRFLTLIGKTAIVVGVVATALRLPENAMGVLRVEPHCIVVKRGSILLTR